MLEFKGFKQDKNKGSAYTSIIFNFFDEELGDESIERLTAKLNDYQMYLEYDSKCEFKIKFKKKMIMEMILTSPIRKVPEDKKELQNFITRHIMDFKEFYGKINLMDNVPEDDVVERI